MVAVLYVERIGSELVDLELAATMLAIGLAEALPAAPTSTLERGRNRDVDVGYCELLW